MHLLQIDQHVLDSILCNTQYLNEESNPLTDAEAAELLTGGAYFTRGFKSFRTAEKTKHRTLLENANFSFKDVQRMGRGISIVRAACKKMNKYSDSQMLNKFTEVSGESWIFIQYEQRVLIFKVERIDLQPRIDCYGFAKSVRAEMMQAFHQRIKEWKPFQSEICLNLSEMIQPTLNEHGGKDDAWLREYRESVLHEMRVCMNHLKQDESVQHAKRNNDKQEFDDPALWVNAKLKLYKLEACMSHTRSCNKLKQQWMCEKVDMIKHARDLSRLAYAVLSSAVKQERLSLIDNDWRNTDIDEIIQFAPSLRERVQNAFTDNKLQQLKVLFENAPKYSTITQILDQYERIHNPHMQHVFSLQAI